MKLEEQVISLEIAKKLKELGVKQNAEFSWLETTDRDDTDRLCWSDEKRTSFELPQQTFEEKYSAFSVSELGEMLPKVIHGKHDNYFLTISYSNMTSKENDGHWCIQYESYLTDEFIGNIISQGKEADVRGKMLIYLIENKLT